MKAFTTILILWASYITTAQNQFNHWYFGDHAGINFNSSPPEADTNGALGSFESCSSISDPNGNLLFYTNGGPYQSFSGGVWNKNHQLMPNGNLDSSNTSCNSSAQGALIVPDPGNPSQHYIFTTDCQENFSFSGGLRFHKVDMSLDSGLGDVIATEVPVITNTTLTEALICIKHSNNIDYWVIACEIGTNNYFTVLVTSNGIQPAVISSLGSTNSPQAGQLSSNSCGDQIAYAATGDTYLFSFDNNTGILSDFLSLGIKTFGCAFSPNDRFLYASKSCVGSCAVYQFDLLAANISGSAQIIGYNTSVTGSMRLGPDQKIYQSIQYSPYLGIIDLPNNLNCTYTSSGFFLGGKNSVVGLPNFYFGNDCSSLTLNESREENSIVTFPNPFTDALTVKVGDNQKIRKVTIKNINGKIIANQIVNNSNQFNIEVQGSSGVYFLETELNSGEILFNKVIKQ